MRGHYCIKTWSFNYVTWASIGNIYYLGVTTVPRLATLKQIIKRYWADNTFSTNPPTDRCKTISPLSFKGCTKIEGLSAKHSLILTCWLYASGRLSFNLITIFVKMNFYFVHWTPELNEKVSKLLSLVQNARFPFFVPFYYNHVYSFS